MHAIAQTHAFTRAAEEAGMSEEEISSLTDFLAENPMAGDEIPGTGGCRKLRVAAPGMGKRGGYRVVTFFSGEAIPVFLINRVQEGRAFGFV